MNKKKLIIAAALSCVMLAGCGDKDNTSSGGKSPASLSGSTVSKPENSIPESNSDSDVVIFYNINDLTKQLLDDVEFPSMVAVKEDNLEVYYGFTKDDVEAYSAYICGSGAMPDEFGIFIAKDENSALLISRLLEVRLEYQKKTYKDYPTAANELYKLDDCFVSINGKTVTYAICADNNRAKDILG